MATKPVTLGPFLGVNNRRPDTGMNVPKVGDFLRSAVNVDLDAAGKTKLRSGYVLVQAGVDCHSMFGAGAFGYFVDGTNLYRVRRATAGVSVQTVRSDMTAHLRVSYAVVGAEIFYSNGIQRGRLREASADSDWGTLPDFNDAGSPAYLWRQTPAGSIVRYYKGRLLVVRGTVMYLAQPYSPAVYDPVRGYISFATPVTLVVPLDTGVFIATTDKTFWASGDLSETSLAEVLPYGGTPGSDAPVPGAEAAIWASPRGLVRATNDGKAENLQEAHVATDRGTRGATVLREIDGMKKAISALSGIDATNMSASSYMQAEVIRKGITL